MSQLSLRVAVERFNIAGRFTISRGSKTEAVVVTALLSDGAAEGRGECVPYTRYGETVDAVVGQLIEVGADVAQGMTRVDLQSRLPRGAARNALDCAYWDLEAKRRGRRVWALAGLPEPQPVATCYTLSLDHPDVMEAKAQAASRTHSILKIKLGGDGDQDRLWAVRRGAPHARLLVDANEGWSPSTCADLIAVCHAARVDLIEQPFPAGQDALMGQHHWPMATCADESVHGLDSLERIAPHYSALNIKLDKTGGLTEAIALTAAARARGLDVFVGCMVGTSLGMAPAMLLTPFARYVDLDGPLLLAQDRQPGLTYGHGLVHPPAPDVWG